MHDREIVRETVDGQMAAVADHAPAATLMQRQQPRRQIDPVDPVETEAIESHESVASAAEQFEDSGVFRPLRPAQTAETGNELANFLFRRFKPDVRGLPGATRRRVRRI
jgi:hypothetical protein